MVIEKQGDTVTMLKYSPQSIEEAGGFNVEVGICTEQWTFYTQNVQC